jgi:hypothetical protein
LRYFEAGSYAQNWTNWVVSLALVSQSLTGMITVLECRPVRFVEQGEKTRDSWVKMLRNQPWVPSQIVRAGLHMLVTLAKNPGQARPIKT